MPRLLVADLVCLYLRHCRKASKHAGYTAQQRELVYRDFCERHGPQDVEELQPYHLTDWIDGHDAWKTPSTRKTYAAMIKAVFSWAAIEGRIKRHPFIGVRYPESERRPDMPDEVLDRLCDGCPRRAGQALKFLRLTAARVSELCRADWPDIDLEGAIWLVPLHKSLKRTRKPKKIPLVPPAVDLLRDMHAEAERAGWLGGAVFRNTKGVRWNYRALYRRMEYWKAKLGIECDASTHGIRHRFGTAAVAAGAPIKLISHMMGHASVATTERYYVNLDGEMDAIREAALLGIPKRA